MASAANITPPELIITEGANKRVIVLDNKNTITLGSDPSCDIQIKAEGVASKHAEITVSDEGVEIESFSPDTYINSRQMSDFELVMWNVDLKFGGVEAHISMTHETSKVFVANSRGALQQYTIEKFFACGVCGIEHPILMGCPNEINEGIGKLSSEIPDNLFEFAAKLRAEVRMHGLTSNM